MDLSALSATAPLALLVDGENLSKDRAPEILRLAARNGPPQVRRVYGNAKAVTGWEDHGFRLCPTRPGKNAADMLLCVEAMSLALRDSFGTLVIASSDRDFSYLAEQLREIGKSVIGIGDAKAPVSFRNTCASFLLLGMPTDGPVLADPSDNILVKVRTVVKEAGKAGYPIASLGALHRMGVRISETPEKTWRGWLTARSAVFACDPKGPEARVRLRG